MGLNHSITMNGNRSPARILPTSNSSTTIAVIITAAICCNCSSRYVDDPTRYICATTNSRCILFPMCSNRASDYGNQHVICHVGDIGCRCPGTNPRPTPTKQGIFRNVPTMGNYSTITNIYHTRINPTTINTSASNSCACTNLQGRSVSSFGINLPGKLLCDTNRSKISAIRVDTGIYTNTISANTRTTANVCRSITAGGGQRPRPCNNQTTAADFRPTIIIPPCFYLNCRTAGTTFQRILILYNESHRCPGTSIVRMNGYCRIV